MSYRITYKKSVFKDFSRMEKSEVVKIVSKIDNELIENPEKHPILKGKFHGLRKYRVGDYRVIYSILKEEILILRIAHRKEVYKIK